MWPLMCLAWIPWITKISMPQHHWMMDPNSISNFIYDITFIKVMLKKKKKPPWKYVSKAQIFSDASLKVEHSPTMATSWHWLSDNPECWLRYLTYSNTTYRYLCKSSSSNGLLYLLVVSGEWTKSAAQVTHQSSSWVIVMKCTFIWVKMTSSFSTTILEKYKALWLILNKVYTYTYTSYHIHTLNYRAITKSPKPS